MAFKGLEDRFADKASDIYKKYSNRDGTNLHPLLEYKPNDPNARETVNDSRMLPIGSTKRDLKRLTTWSKSGAGLLFLVKQEAQQLGNTFSETRVINPLFVVGNAVPYVHMRRALAVPSEFALSGDSSDASPASDSRIGSAGRLQRETARDATAYLLGNGGRNNILSLFSASKLINTIVNVFSLKDKGSLGINQRPELDFNNTYFSIALWEGFKKRNGFRDELDSAAANLRVGNFSGAMKSLQRSIDNFSDQVRGLIPDNKIIPDGRNSISDRQSGRRYFITDATNADRYLRNSVITSIDPDGGDFHAANLSFLHRTPYVVDGPEIVRPTLSSQPSTNSIFNIKSAINPSFPIPSLPNFSFNNATQIANAITQMGSTPQGIDTTSENPAENAMLFSGTSLRNRYNNDERLAFIKDQLATQRQKQTEYWNQNRSTLGFAGRGYTPGSELFIDPRVRASNGTGNMSDAVNSQDVFTVTTDQPSDSDITAMKSKMGTTDVVNLWFFDYAQKKILPFRAFVSQLNETANPEYSDTRYIGRTERNIVYMGATRDVSFQLNVHAFAKEELTTVWKKIDHLTGLVFPGTYTNGFMVPPFTYFTLGNVYYNQPCYIKNLGISVEDGTSWEIDDGAQVPHGVKMSITLSIIEKRIMQSGVPYHNITERVV